MQLVQYDALYARQSVDKKDSISIQSQLEFCRYEARGSRFREYSDKGYSGKNTDRPDFIRLMRDIRAGLIKRVIVYKLDRISRSILDFANMMETFQKYGVEFVSSTEKFDTSTPMGRAMLNICIVFAQLERETIQMRVSDAYHSRAMKGFLMGCPAPYGYKRVPYYINGIKTACYEEVPEEMEQVDLIYKLYTEMKKPDGTLYTTGSIVDYLIGHGIKNLRGKLWQINSISAILGNTVYAKADLALYDFFVSQGAKVISPAELWRGGNGCYLYRERGVKGRTMHTYKDRCVVLAPHTGRIPSDVWIRARMRALNHLTRATGRNARVSWLLGKLKCGYCHHAVCINGIKPRRYMQCGYRNSTRGQGWSGLGGTVYADAVEDYIFQKLQEKLAEFTALAAPQQQANPLFEENKLRIAQIDDEIDALVAKVPQANETLMRLINEKVEQLDAEKRELSMKNVSITSVGAANLVQSIFSHVEDWSNATVAQKQQVVDALIERIYITKDDISVFWNI